MKSVLLDSNVYRKILIPEDFPKDPNIQKAKDIKQAILDGALTAFLSETIFSIEAIERKDRTTFLSGGGKTTTTVKSNEETVGLSISLEPKRSITLDQYRNKYLTEAIKIGVKVIKLPRIGFPRTSLPEEAYIPFNIDNFEKACQLGRDIEMAGFGMAHIKSFQSDGKPWHREIINKDKGAVANAFSEWADGDSVSIAYGCSIDYFCSEDKGKSSLKMSILSDTGKQWLKNSYGICVLTLSELHSVLFP